MTLSSFPQEVTASGSAVTNDTLSSAFPSFVDPIARDLGAFLPEIILSLGAMWVILYDVFSKREKSAGLGWHVLGFLGLTLVSLLTTGFHESRSLFSGMLAVDGFGTLTKVLILIGSAICVGMTMNAREFESRRMGEFYGLLLGSIVGMFLMASATNLLTIFIGIEFASYASYLLAGFLKEDRRSAEGSVKYVIYGSVASGAMVYGFSLLFGLTGSLDLEVVADRLIATKVPDITLIMAVLMCFAGFGYKIAAFPMHYWSPDVYEGSSIPFTAFLSVVSKTAGFATLVRFIIAVSSIDAGQAPSGGALVDWATLVGIIAALTMTVGNLAALFQQNLKRLLAYSSIAHAGYLLMGIAVLGKTQGTSSSGWDSVIFYLITYLFMNLGAFAVVSIVASRTGKESVDEMKGLGSRNALLAVCAFGFLISLIGLPPTAGFTGKWRLLLACTEQKLTWLTVVAVLNTVVAVYYYARIIKLMFLEKAEAGTRIVLSRPAAASLIAILVPVIYLGVFFGGTVDFINRLAIYHG